MKYIDINFSPELFELLNQEMFYSMAEARAIIEQWRQHDNQIRPHSSLGYKPPAPKVIATQETKPSSTTLHPALSLVH